MLETVTRVVGEAGRPMRACEIHVAAERLVGVPMLWSSVKGTLSAYSRGEAPRFRRVGRGVYELAHCAGGGARLQSSQDARNATKPLTDES